MADEGDEIKIEYADDNSAYVTVFAGDVSVKTLTQFEGNTAFFEYQCRDFTARLDDTIITLARNVTEDANDRITWIFSQGEDFAGRFPASPITTSCSAATSASPTAQTRSARASGRLTTPA